MPSTSAMLTMMIKIKKRPILIVLPCVKSRPSGSIGRTFRVAPPEKAEAPPGESRASFGKQGIGRGRSASEVRLWRSKKGSNKQQRRLSGVCSLGGVAVDLDMQFPSTDMSVQLGKGSINRSIFRPRVFSHPRMDPAIGRAGLPDRPRDRRSRAQPSWGLRTTIRDRSKMRSARCCCDTRAVQKIFARAGGSRISGASFIAVELGGGVRNFAMDGDGF
jgi:hypothetical protein